MGRGNQAASNSHATTGTLTGGTRRLRTHPLRSLVLVAIAVLVFQAAYVAPTVGAEPSAPPVVEPAAPDPVTSPDPTAAPTPDATPVPDVTAVPSADPTAAPAVMPTPAPVTTPTPLEAPVATELPAKDGTIGLLPPLPAGAVEVVAKRSETSRTYTDAAGRTVTELYTNPVFFRPQDTGPLTPVRLGFVGKAGDTAVTSDQAPMAVSVAPAVDPRGFLAVTVSGHTITYRPLTTKGLPATAATPPAIDGAAAGLRDVIPGVDLRVLAQSRSASVFFILDRPADATALTFAIEAPGLALQPDADGQLVFRAPRAPRWPACPTRGPWTRHPTPRGSARGA